ncbi:MAG: hypothetical protein WCO86_09745 [Planctomycetota bacterium]
MTIPVRTMNENPYQPPTTTVTQISVPPTRKFRWGIIPATFFWLYLPAVVMVSGGCVILTLRSWRRFAELWAAGERAIPLLASALPPLSVCAVIAIYSCANAWMKGRWRRAILLTVVFCAVNAVGEKVTSHLIPTVYARILFTNKIPRAIAVRGEEWHRPPGL